MHKRTFSPAKKSAIVLAVITNKHTLQEVCTEHQIVPSLVHKWKERFLKDAHTIFEDPASTEVDKKVQKYEHVIAKLTTQNDFLEKVLSVTK
jgi:transposase-like protein